MAKSKATQRPLHPDPHNKRNVQASPSRHGRKKDSSPRRFSKSTTSNNNNNHHKKPDVRQIHSRKEITVVTMNMNGRGVLGLTPRYKMDMIEKFIEGVPDVIIMQDAIEYSDIATVLDKVAGGKYECHFNPDHSNRSGQEDDEEMDKHVTGVAWDKDKYIGTPLQMDDKNLSSHSKWLKQQNVVVVKLDSAQITADGKDDVHPSFIAISWHGPDYEMPLKKRCGVCQEFFRFLAELRSHNWNIPILIGGDFNMDMKSFEMDSYPDFLCVPYRPVSGSLAKDLKNTFLFTMDSLQVTETAFKQHHPEIFASPFITVKVRGRTRIKIWAVVKIQRAVRAFLQKVREQRVGKKKLKDSKKRWKKKIEGEDYESEEEEEEILPSTTDDNHDTGIRRNSTGTEGSKTLNDDFYNKPMPIPVSNHRRKKFSDLKSVQERNKEMAVNSHLVRQLGPSEKFEF